jgi:hypothetical protein
LGAEELLTGLRQHDTPLLQLLRIVRPTLQVGTGFDDGQRLVPNFGSEPTDLRL